MAEPTFQWQVNYGTEGSPTWETVSTDTLRWCGPAGIGDAFPAPVSGAVWFDNTTAPDDGELWLDTSGTDRHVVGAGRNTNTNVLQINETGGEPTADPPELTAYDDATDAGNRTAPANYPMIGTTETSNISALRAVETTGGAPGAGWTGQVHGTEPTEGSSLDGENNKETCASAHAGSDTKKFNLAQCLPYDVPVSGLNTFVYSYQYTYT